MQRITIEEVEYETEDGGTEYRDSEFIEVNANAMKEIQEIATEDNLRFGEAVVAYLERELLSD